MSKQFNDVSCKYGAPMGRREDGYLETRVRRFVRLFRVRLDSGGYDDGGAYWGIGTPLFCAEDDDGNRQFVRAVSRRQACFLLDLCAQSLKAPGTDCTAGALQSYGQAMLDGRAPMPKAWNNGMPVTRESVIEWMKWNGAAMGQDRNQYQFVGA